MVEVQGDDGPAIQLVIPAGLTVRLAVIPIRGEVGVPFRNVDEHASLHPLGFSSASGLNRTEGRLRVYCS